MVYFFVDSDTLVVKILQFGNVLCVANQNFLATMPLCDNFFRGKN